MLVLLSQAAYAHHAHLACRVLHEHGVEAYVFHEGADNLYSGTGSMTASLWVHEEELQDVRDILNTAPVESLPQEEAPEKADLPAEHFPPLSAVGLGVGGILFAGSALVACLAFSVGLITHGANKAVDSVLAFVPVLLFEAFAALVVDLAVGALCTVLFQVIRLFLKGSIIAAALMTMIGLAITAIISMSLVN